MPFHAFSFDAGGEDQLVSVDEWDRFAKSEGSRFPPCQYSPGLVATNGNSGIVLVGDAAHTFPPDLGQGVNAALGDVAVLDNSLSQSDSLSDALEAYEKNRGPEVSSMIFTAFQLFCQFLIHDSSLVSFAVSGIGSSRSIRRSVSVSTIFSTYDCPSLSLDNKHCYPPDAKQDITWSRSQTCNPVNDGSKPVLPGCHASSRFSDSIALRCCSDDSVEGYSETNVFLTMILVRLLDAHGFCNFITFS